MKALNVLSLVVGLVALALAFTLWTRQPLGGVAVTGSLAPSIGFPPGKGDVAKDLGLSVIVLETNDKGVCGISSKTVSSHGNQGKDTHWLVLNGCTGTVTITFQDFKKGDPQKGPFTAPPSFTVTNVFQVVKAHVDPQAAIGDYQFTMYVNGVAQTDPDIVIDN